MLGTIQTGLIIALTTVVGVGYYHVQNLETDLKTARENVTRLELAVKTTQASLELSQAEQVRLGDLNKELGEELQAAERYGDELRATLQRHNLTHLASQKPGLVEKRMQDATDELWNSLQLLTTTGVQPSADPGTRDSNSN